MILVEALLCQVLGAEGESNEINEIELKSLKSNEFLTMLTLYGRRRIPEALKKKFIL